MRRSDESKPLDAILLGNIAIQNVESDSLTYNFAARYGVNPRLTLNLGVTYALSQHAILVTMPGVGMTPDAQDYSVTFKIPYMF